MKDEDFGGDGAEHRQQANWPLDAIPLKEILKYAIQVPGIVIALSVCFSSAWIFGKVFILPGLATALSVTDLASEAIMVAPVCMIFLLISYSMLTIVPWDEVKQFSRMKISSHQIRAGMLVLALSFVPAYYFDSFFPATLGAVSAVALIFSALFNVNKVIISARVNVGLSPYIHTSVVFFYVIVIASAIYYGRVVTSAERSGDSRSMEICLRDECQRGYILASLSSFTAVKYSDSQDIKYVRTDDIRSFNRSFALNFRGIIHGFFEIFKL